MSTAKEQLLKIINEIPESQLAKILDFAEYLRDKQKGKLQADLSKASESSLDFWNNDVDDEVWNDV
ncbi:DUF2281 domain-containing protein [Pueribacillus theae]|uniref:DUF2281 domain-containing protein n=1 Tax=Pueribacillus theae TaxID=2171751 RepID=A0A2U1K4S9_9BACI|nr:DUF2281 domain-containing protein [Pueribacillus theae]PWA11948.1 DUF2281 domain-containing protein [Pueribacillus theae]